MSVTYGFYNALNHDRLYDALQMSSLFDGIIQDGVFSTIGETFICKASGDGLIVNVGSGRAWFNHTWTLNDADYPVQAETAEVVLDRIDALVLEVNSTSSVRANSIHFVKGIPSSNPSKPALINTADIHQHALAYVTIRASQTTIYQSDIENVVGTSETPFVTGLMQQASVDNLILQWQAEFEEYLQSFEATSEVEYDNWFAQMQADMASDFDEFDTWFQHMKDQLSEDAAGHLQEEIDDLATQVEKGSIVVVTTTDTRLYNKAVSVNQNDQSVLGTFDGSGIAYFASVPFIGSTIVRSTDGIRTYTADLYIPYFGRYFSKLAFWTATLNIYTPMSELYKRPVSIFKDGELVGTTYFDANGSVSYDVHEVGSYTVTSTTAGGNSYSRDVTVSSETTYSVKIGYTMYGFKIKNNESVPASKVSYDVRYNNQDVENRDYTPASTNLSTGEFNYGSWSPNNFFMPVPVLLSQDCQSKIYLNPNDYSKDIEGNDVSSYLTGATGSYNAMMEWGKNGEKIWYKVVPDTNAAGATIYVCDERIDNDFHAWSFFDQDDNMTDHFYTSIYEGSVVSNVLRSLSGKTPGNNQQGTVEITEARANNKHNKVEWYIRTYADWVLINLLAVMISRTTNTQLAFGNGNMFGGSSASSLKTTGILNTAGLFYGKGTNTDSVKIFGMENWYADRWERMAGLITNGSSVMLYKLTYGTADGSASAGYYETSGSAPNNYLTGNTAPSASGNYISAELFRTNGSMLPLTVAGSDSTDYCDGMWASTNGFAIVGGACNSGAICGAFTLNVADALSYAYWHNGASLSCRPIAS